MAGRDEVIVLNPVDVAQLIGDDCISGRERTEMHPAVANWVASCFVTTAKTHELALARDESERTVDYHRSFCLGAVNSHHWACQVADVGVADEAQLRAAMKELGGVPGAFLSTAPEGERGTRVTLRLYAADGSRLSDGNGLAKIRDLIARDHVPLPVNAQSKGEVHDRRDLLAGE